MNDNRYAAPATLVADVEDAAIGERPRNVVIGVSLLWIQLALGIPGHGLPGAESACRDH